MASKIKVVLRNKSRDRFMDYDIIPHDHSLADAWVSALKDLLRSGYVLEKNYCWHGFPNTSRDLSFLCDELNKYIGVINHHDTQRRWVAAGLLPYVIEEHFTPDAVRFPKSVGPGLTEQLKALGARQELHLALSIKHDIMNRLHNHFERLQGTVGQLSEYYLWANDDAKWAIRQLNNLCHEIESLCLSQRKAEYDPEWIRPSQITTWLAAPRHELTAEHRQLFDSNQYDREFGGVYMHWAQIGKTLYEVWRDEGAPNIDRTTCEAITELKYFSGEFDVEWGRSVTRRDPWHADEQKSFKQWLQKQGYDKDDNAGLSLGYLPLGKVNMLGSFGTDNFQGVLALLSNHMDIYAIEADDVKAVYDYHWSDANWRDKQIEFLKPGYRYSSKT